MPWNAETIVAFEACKAEFTNAILLAHPIEEATLLLSTDASDTAIGASLEQVNNNQLSPIAFFSKKNFLTHKRNTARTIEAFSNL